MNSSGVHQDSGGAPPHDGGMKQGTPHPKPGPQNHKKNDKKKNKWATRASILRTPGRSQAAMPLLAAASWWVTGGKPFILRPSLRLQPLDAPAIAAGAIHQPVVQPVAPPL